MPTLFDADLVELLAALRGPPGATASHAGIVLDKAVQAARSLAESRADVAEAEKEADKKSDKAPKAVRREPGRYFPLMRIDIRHDFFNRPAGVCDEVAIWPTAETSRQLALFGLIPRLRPDGIDILWSTGLQDDAVARLRPLVDLIATIPAAKRAQAAESIGRQLFGQPLFFVVSVTNPLFANFTEIPAWFRIGDRPLLLSNRAAKPREEEHNHADLIVDWQSRAKQPPPKIAPKTMPTWAKEEEARKKEAAVRKASMESSASLVAADTAAGFDAHRKVETRSRRFALLDLHLVRAPGSAPAAAGGWDGMPISLDPGGDKQDPKGGGIFHPCTYTLRFEARRTRWRYIVAARSGELDAASLAVVGPNGAEDRFELAAKRRILPDGRAAACFTSVDPLPILARPNDEHAFALRSTANGGRARPRMLIDRLPAAGIHSISPEPSQVWSDIYVFV